VNREDEHLVIRKQEFFDGLAKPDPVKLFAVEIRVVHRADGRIHLLGLGLGDFAIDARCGGHVEALAGVQECVVVDLDEGGFVVSFESHASGSMGFIAYNQIEGASVIPLGLRDDINGLVG